MKTIPFGAAALLMLAAACGSEDAKDPTSSSSTVALDVGAPPVPFHMPFPCGAVWRGSTYAGHNGGQPGGYYSIDWVNQQGSSYGQQVVATAAGTVVPVNPDPNGYGNFLDVAHGGGWSTRYAHLSAIFVHPGDHVEAGTVVGLSGATGHVTGAHLHYEQRYSGVIEPSVFEGQPFNYGGETMTSANCGQAAVGSDGCTDTERSAFASFGCQCVDHQGSGGFCAGHGCTADEEGNVSKFGCQCVDHQGGGGFCGGHGCTAKEEQDFASFGCQCVDHQGGGGFCAGHGCTAKEEGDAAQMGCSCVDHQPSGGNCPGLGCTAKEQTDCSNAGHACSRHTCT